MYLQLLKLLGVDVAANNRKLWLLARRVDALQQPRRWVCVGKQAHVAQLGEKQVIIGGGCRHCEARRAEAICFIASEESLRAQRSNL